MSQWHYRDMANTPSQGRHQLQAVERLFFPAAPSRSAAALGARAEAFRRFTGLPAISRRRFRLPYTLVDHRQIADLRQGSASVVGHVELRVEAPASQVSFRNGGAKAFPAKAFHDRDVLARVYLCSGNLSRNCILEVCSHPCRTGGKSSGTATNRATATIPWAFAASNGPQARTAVAAVRMLD